MPKDRPQTTSNRGFAAMDADRQREIAKKGGESVPAEKRSFSLNRALAAEAGRKGGQSVAEEDRSFYRNRQLASEAGRNGGEASHTGLKQATGTTGNGTATTPPERRPGAFLGGGGRAALPPGVIATAAGLTGWARLRHAHPAER